MMHIQCACGSEFEVSEVYAGGQVHCHACGATVLVPADQAEDDKFRFQCPHCKARVIGRKSSAGKKSQCPACEEIYIVPDPPSESVSPSPKESRRIELSTDDLALRIGLPFPVGKLEPPIAAPPQPRYVHSPFDRPDDGQQFEPLHTMAVPVQHQAETTKLDLRADRSAQPVGPGPQQDDQQTTTFLASAPPPLASRLAARRAAGMGADAWIACVGHIEFRRDGRGDAANDRSDKTGQCRRITGRHGRSLRRAHPPRFPPLSDRGGARLRPAPDQPPSQPSPLRLQKRRILAADPRSGKHERHLRQRPPHFHRSHLEAGRRGPHRRRHLSSAPPAAAAGDSSGSR